MDKKIILFLVLIGAVLLLAGCASQPTPCPECPTCEVCPEPVTCPTAEACPEVTCPEVTCPEPAAEAPFMDLWAASAHADAEAEAFVHWNEEDPAEIPVFCAKCHSADGFLDYLGADGSEAFKVDKAAAIGSVITCTACHNDATMNLTTVKFPAVVKGENDEIVNIQISGLGKEAVCMTCHQGNAAGSSVDAAIAEKAGENADPDAVAAELGFVNIHYYAAAATLYGTEVKGGYQYPGKAYDAKFDHIDNFQTCTDCHDSHTLQVKVNQCAFCHEGVTGTEDLKNVRMVSSSRDYDGDGNVEEGIYYEVEGLREMLYTAIQAYAKEVAGTAIVYSKDAYPYFFVDTNGDGQVAEDEASFPNSYKSWTPRLLKAAYNFQVSMKDPGAFAHNGKYIIELLYDSIADLNSKLSTPVDLSAANRNDAGHFDASAEAWRHWDSEGSVPQACAKCHSATGLPLFNKESVVISQPVSSGLSCYTCHDHNNWPARIAFTQVTFPSGAKLTFGEGQEDANLCINCHQGRESTVSVNKATAGKEGDTPDDKLAFLNVHYFAAGASLFGTEAKGAYEFEGKTYAGRFMHTAGFETCINCHDAHELAPDPATCKGCHQTEDPATIRMTHKDDYDGDGDTTEGLKAEIDGLYEQLYAAIQAYTVKHELPALVYGDIYPYFVVDTNGNGVADPDEATRANAYKPWTPNLLKAAYNLQYVHKDPGAYVHNAVYIIQILRDSIEVLGGEVGGVRP